MSLNEKIIDAVLFKLRDIFILVTATMIDCLEQAFDCMTYAGGNNLKWVLLVVSSFIPVNLFCTLLGVTVFIPWQDCVVALFVMIIIYCINHATKVGINESVAKIRSSVDSIKKKGADIKCRTKIS